MNFFRYFFICVFIVITAFITIYILHNNNKKSEYQTQISDLIAKVELLQKDIDTMDRYVRTYASDKYRDHIEIILNQKDSRFEAISERDVQNWPIYTHPAGVYSIRYPPQMKPVVLPPVESSFEKIIFQPKSSYRDTLVLPPDWSFDESDFYVSIYFWAGGGGMHCSNAICVDIHDYPQYYVSAELPEITVPGVSEASIDEKLYRNSIQFVANILPIGRNVYETHVYSIYYSRHQREIIRLMLSTLKINSAILEKNTPAE